MNESQPGWRLGPHTVPVYVSAPQHAGGHPAIILIHEVWGVDEHIRSVADRLSAEGFAVFAPDLFSGTGITDQLTPELRADLADPVRRLARQVEFRTLLAPLQSTDFAAATLGKLRALVELVQAREGVTSVAVIGFCFGGGYAYALAANEPRLAAAVAFYGHNGYAPSDFARVAAPVLAFYGENDAPLIAQIPGIAGQMTAADKKFEHVVYPGAGHAFFNDTNAATYRPDAASDAWRRTLEFLRANRASP